MFSERWHEFVKTFFFLRRYPYEVLYSGEIFKTMMRYNRIFNQQDIDEVIHKTIPKKEDYLVTKNLLSGHLQKMVCLNKGIGILMG